MLSTGLDELDDVTGGFAPGQVWILIGTPGQGRSTLAAQWAMDIASEHSIRTELISLRDPIHRVTARLLARTGKIPLGHLWDREDHGADEPWLTRASDLLKQAPLRLAGPQSLTRLGVDLPSTRVPLALVVDDADGHAGVFPARVASLAAQGVLVILTMPRDCVLTEMGVNPEWARACDFVIDVERPDWRERPGEADLNVVRNRWGPERIISVAFHGHWARFVDHGQPIQESELTFLTDANQDRNSV